jgi:stage II sporulation protein D
MKRIFQKFTITICFLILIFLLTACSRSPERSQEKLRAEPTITLFINDTGETKEIKLEEYLKGVVAAEMDPTWPDEALKAQAILARTFTLKKIEQGGVKARGTDASTSVEEFQAYDPSRINDKVTSAVEGTRGKVVTYQGRLINGWFYADGGGVTSASAAEGLAYFKEEAPYIKSVKDPGSEISPAENKSWTVSFPVHQVKVAVNQVTGQDVGNASSASIIEKGPSGRVTKLKIGEVTVSGPALRLALGSEQMRSTLLTQFEMQNGNLIISGQGYGHGVGMSQWGARALADQGKNAEGILSYFFNNIKIEQYWN